MFVPTIRHNQQFFFFSKFVQKISLVIYSITPISIPNFKHFSRSLANKKSLTNKQMDEQMNPKETCHSNFLKDGSKLEPQKKPEINFTCQRSIYLAKQSVEQCLSNEQNTNKNSMQNIRKRKTR